MINRKVEASLREAVAAGTLSAPKPKRLPTEPLQGPVSVRDS